MSHPVLMIAKQEFLLNVRNRWVITFSVLFTFLTLLLSGSGMVTSGYSGFQDFVRTAASLTNLCGFLIPLFVLVIGVMSFISNREFLDLLVTQPISRDTVLLGKYLGILLTVTASTIAGFGLPGVVISLSIGVTGALQYLYVVLQMVLLAMIFSGLAMMISLLAKRRQIALGVAFGVWLFYELLYGLLVLGSTLYFTPAFLKTALIAALLGNPIDLSRVLSLLAVGGAHMFGPAGATLIKLTHSSNSAAAIGMSALLLWVVMPVLISLKVFRRQDF